MTKALPLIWQDTTFGEHLVFDVPPDCNCIIVGVLKHQFVPVDVLLPHQAYKERLAEILIEHDATTIHIIPYSSKTGMTFDLAGLRAKFEAQKAADEAAKLIDHE
jgi:hypothetical protein